MKTTDLGPPEGGSVSTPTGRRCSIAGWGRFPRWDGLQAFSEDLGTLTEGARLSRGLGRSYGDSSLPASPEDLIANTTLADRLLEFDESTGRLRAEAGLSLHALNRVLLPRGWFVAVTPGTQLVTLGGMVASDVHGKNHHVDGCIGPHIRRLLLRTGQNELVHCSREEHPELFLATIGGMGLTGHVLEVEMQMVRVPSPWIFGQSQRVRNLDEMIAGLKKAAAEWPMTVGWVDCLTGGRDLGRGILMVGRWAEAEEAADRRLRFKGNVRVPIEMPDVLLNRASMKAFNSLYYWKHQPAQRQGLAHPEAFFYPLDALGDWNLIYGRRGFTQYQCVLPVEHDNEPARRLLSTFLELGGQSFLCVIKDCGPEGDGILSFPRPGISIAIDFPIHPKRTQRIVDALNERVIEYGGRIYLTKDAFTRPEHFRKMEPRLERFQEIRYRWDPEGRLRSAQSVRLFPEH